MNHETEGKAGHTAVPWGYVYDGSSEWSIGPADDPQSNPVMTIWSKDDAKAEANAAFVVKAVNAYELIIEALNEAEKIYNNDLAGLHVVRMVWEAITKAESAS